MYTKEQVSELFDLISVLKDSSSAEGCPPELTTVESSALSALFKKAGELKEHDQKLYIGTYEHRHGVDTHGFLITDGVEFSNQDYKNWLDDFEYGESAAVNLASLTFIDKQPEPVHIHISVDTADGCQGVETFDENGSTGPMRWDKEANLETVRVVIEKVQGDSVLGSIKITGDQWRELDCSEVNGSPLFEALIEHALEGYSLECFDSDSDLYSAIVSRLSINATQIPRG